MFGKLPLLVQPIMSDNTAFIAEIFPSIQGEGLYVGDLHFFVRFAGCNLDCYYCDTKESFKKSDNFVFQGFSGVKKIYNNPIGTKDFLEIFENYSNETISFTGGEPLLHTGFLKKILPDLKKNGHTIYLETNGTLVSELNEVINSIDIISMDYKLDYTIQNKLDSHKLHEEFYRVAIQKEVFIKVVVDSMTTISDIEKCAEMISEIKKNHLIIQPVTGTANTPTEEHLIALFMTASEYLPAKLIPQCHKYMCIK